MNRLLLFLPPRNFARIKLRGSTCIRKYPTFGNDIYSIYLNLIARVFLRSTDARCRGLAKLRVRDDQKYFSPSIGETSSVVGVSLFRILRDAAEKFNNLLFLRFGLIFDFRQVGAWEGGRGRGEGDETGGASGRSENSNRRFEWSLFYVPCIPLLFILPSLPPSSLLPSSHRAFAIYFAIVFAPPDPYHAFQPRGGCAP